MSDNECFIPRVVITCEKKRVRLNEFDVRHIHAACLNQHVTFFRGDLKQCIDRLIEGYKESVTAEVTSC